MAKKFERASCTPINSYKNVFGIQNLFIKDESFHKTHTFKDRLSLELLKPVYEKLNLGENITKTTFGSISYGNTALSLGYHCANLNQQYGEELVNAIAFVPPELKNKILGPDSEGLYVAASAMLTKIEKKCTIIEVDLSQQIYKENDLEKLARASGKCLEKYIDVTEGLNRVAYAGIISEIVEEQLQFAPDYIIVPFGAGILCNEIMDYLKDNNLTSKVIPVSSGNPNSIAIMLYGPIWINCNDLMIYGKAYTRHSIFDRKGRYREPYLVFNVDDDEIISVIPLLKQLNISCEPSAASGFAILHRLKEISPEFEPDKHSVLVINTGNGLLNYV
jgi:cysteine synthase